MTQPAVSNALRRLRDALHDELVVRAGYGVQPTPRALELWPAVRAALGQLRATIQPGASTGRAAQQLRARDGRRDRRAADAAAGATARGGGARGVPAGAAADHPRSRGNCCRRAS
jgi:DNA-binding transcriptional LysR family regulator